MHTDEFLPPKCPGQRLSVKAPWRATPAAKARFWIPLALAATLTLACGQRPAPTDPVGGGETKAGAPPPPPPPPPPAPAPQPIPRETPPTTAEKPPVPERVPPLTTVPPEPPVVIQSAPQRKTPSRAKKAAPKRASPTAAAVHENRSVDVYYGTNRARSVPCRLAPAVVAGECHPNEFYGGENSPSGLEVGELTVTFPPTHEKGKVERPLAILTIELETEDPEKHVILARIEPLTDKQQWARRIRDSGREEALLYVHGYNVNFATAARQAAQIAYDLDFDGLPLLYSWPSQGTYLGYRTDEGMVKTAEAPIDEFLRLLSMDAKITKLHVISHSMGNRLMAALLEKKFTQGRPGLIDQLILAAPDIDAGEFESKFARILPKLARRTTLYVSDRDVALAASAKLHRNPRAGHVAGGLLGLGGLDTIDASDVETDFVSHSYYAEGKSVLADIFCVLAGTNADLRAMLTKHEKPPRGAWWRVRGADSNGVLPRDPGKCAPPGAIPTQTNVDTVLTGGWAWAGWLGAVVAMILMALLTYRWARRFRGAEVR